MNVCPNERKSTKQFSLFILDFLSKSTWGVFALPPLIGIFLPPIKPTLFSSFAGEQFFSALICSPGYHNIITFIPYMSQFWFLIVFVFKILVVWKLKATSKTASKRILEGATQVKGDKGAILYIWKKTVFVCKRWLPLSPYLRLNNRPLPYFVPRQSYLASSGAQAMPSCIFIN